MNPYLKTGADGRAYEVEGHLTQGQLTDNCLERERKSLNINYGYHGHAQMTDHVQSIYAFVVYAVLDCGLWCYEDVSILSIYMNMMMMVDCHSLTSKQWDTCTEHVVD